MDLRERILSSYDKEEGTREEIAARYRVSLGMVKKLLQQRRRTGDIGPRHHRSGRKALIVEAHRQQMRGLLCQKPDLTLAQLRSALGLQCTVQAIHYALVDLGLTYKKRRFARPNKSGLTLPKRVGGGGGGREVSTRRDWSSSTKRAPRRT
jgi:transposase